MCMYIYIYYREKLSLFVFPINNAAKIEHVEERDWT